MCRARQRAGGRPSHPTYLDLPWGPVRSKTAPKDTQRCLHGSSTHPLLRAATMNKFKIEAHPRKGRPSLTGDWDLHPGQRSIWEPRHEYTKKKNEEERKSKRKKKKKCLFLIVLMLSLSLRSENGFRQIGSTSESLLCRSPKVMQFMEG